MAHVEDLVQSQVVLEAEGIVGWSVNPYEVASLVVKLVFELSHPQRGFNSPVNVVTNKQHMRIGASMFPERFDLVASLPRGPQNLSIVSVSEITGHLFLDTSLTEKESRLEEASPQPMLAPQYPRAQRCRLTENGEGEKDLSASSDNEQYTEHR